MSSPILDMENINMRLGPSNMGRCGNGRGVHFGGVTMHPLIVLHPIPFLFLVPKNTKGMPTAGQQLAERAHRVGHTRVGYSLYAFKSPAPGLGPSWALVVVAALGLPYRGLTPPFRVQG